MLCLSQRPRLRSHVRLRFDRVRGDSWLLCPERGLLLNTTASRVLELCDGSLSLGEITSKLEAAHEGATSGAIERDVVELALDLVARGLMTLED